jgi:ketosteroid isomerase-like protein
MIRHAMIFLALTVAVCVPANAGPAEDATATVTTWMDKFNAGDMDAFSAGHAQNAVIVDEFAPHVWTGADAPKRWLEDYVKDSTAHGISKGHMDYATPVRADASDTAAYIVMPTIYSFQQGGRKKSAAGSMTFVMTKVGNDWKIASWTYSATAPK